MSAGEEMMREQLDRIIARTELRIDRQCIHARALAPYGDEAKRGRRQLTLMLTGLAKLRMLRDEFPEPQPGSAYRAPAGGLAG